MNGIFDLLYKPFSPWMSRLTFRYAACGGINTLIGLLAYYFSFHYCFDQSVVNLQFIAFKPHVAALLVSGMVSFALGFLFNKYLVFVGSDLRGRVQLFRYALSFSLNIVLNYLLLRFLVEWAGIDAFVSQLATTLVVITVGYLTQRYFTFKV